MAERKNRSTLRKKVDPKKNEILFSILNGELSDRIILSSLDHDPQDDEDAKALKWCQNVFQDENGMVYEEYLVSFLMDTYSLCQNALRMFEDISAQYAGHLDERDSGALDLITRTFSDLLVNILSTLMELERFISLDSAVYEPENKESAEDALDTLYVTLTELKEIADTIDHVSILADELLEKLDAYDDDPGTIRIFPDSHPRFNN